MQAGEKLRQEVERLFLEHDGRSINVTISVGVSVWQAGQTQSWQELLNAADQALYRAKETRRNRVAR
jgi:diguanylate cyclase (GGDEF)-like protein